MGRGRVMFISRSCAVVNAKLSHNNQPVRTVQCNVLFSFERLRLRYICISIQPYHIVYNISGVPKGIDWNTSLLEISGIFKNAYSVPR